MLFLFCLGFFFIQVGFIVLLVYYFGWVFVLFGFNEGYENFVFMGTLQTIRFTRKFRQN